MLETSKFKVGNIVKVLKVDDSIADWNKYIIDDWSDYIGKVGEVDKLLRDDSYFDYSIKFDDGNVVNFREYELELIESYDTVDDEIKNRYLVKFYLTHGHTIEVVCEDFKFEQNGSNGKFLSYELVGLEDDYNLTLVPSSIVAVDWVKL